uniref:Histone H2A n=1 Tax=Solanum lycopersicum TaxID=4081 RepID=A0A3Q7GH05_SOLLC
MAGKGKNLGSNVKRRSGSSKAGLKFPVARIARSLKVGKYAKHVSDEAPVFLAVVLEYLEVE